MDFLRDCNAKDDYVDVYGTPLRDGDVVLKCNDDGFHCKICVYKADKKQFYNYAGSIYSTIYTRGTNSYIFKLNNTEISHYTNYYEKLMAHPEVGTYKPDLDDVHEVAEAREEIYRETNKARSLRGIKTADILGKTLQPGDFVYCFMAGKDMTCGIVVSDTQVFTLDGVKKVVHHVFLRKILTRQEEEIKARLMSNYQQSIIRHIGNTGYKCWDMYKTSRDTYIYLGHIDIGIQAVEDTDICINYAVDKNDVYWFKVPYGDSHSLKDYKNIDKFRYMLYNAFTEVEMINKKYQVRPHFVLNYREITNFKAFVTKVPKTVNYVTNIGCPQNEFLFETKGYRSSSNEILYSHKFLLKIKG